MSYAIPPQTLPPITAPPGPAQTPAGTIPPWLVLGVALVVAGGTAQLLYKIKPAAGYGFAALVVIGYIAVGDRTVQLQNFLTHLGVPPGR